MLAQCSSYLLQIMSRESEKYSWQISRNTIARLREIYVDNLSPIILCPPRPLSVSFQFRASGKETDMATMLRLEKYGRIDFSLGRWTPMDPNAPKSMRAHARESFELVTTFFRSLTWWQESLFWRSSCDLCKTTEFGNFRFLSKLFHISQHQYFTYSSPPTVAVQHIGSQCVEVQHYSFRPINSN